MNEPEDEDTNTNSKMNWPKVVDNTVQGLYTIIGAALLVACCLGGLWITWR